MYEDNILVINYSKMWRLDSLCQEILKSEGTSVSFIQNHHNI